MGPEATVACKNDQLCDRLKTISGGVIHGVQALWYKKLSTEEGVFLLVDAKNAFNEINRVGMLWMVQHLWLPRALFVFNCYRHWSSLFLRNRNGTASILHSREGMTQGDPLAMIAYMIGILPLINNIQREIPEITQPWYAENSGDLGTFTRLETYFDSLTRQGPGQGITPSRPRAYSLYAWIISRRENCSGHVTDLGCARAHVILGVTLGTTGTNAIG